MYIRKEECEGFFTETAVNETTYQKRVYWINNGEEIVISVYETTLKEMGWNSLQEFFEIARRWIFEGLSLFVTKCH